MALFALSLCFDGLTLTSIVKFCNNPDAAILARPAGIPVYLFTKALVFGFGFCDYNRWLASVG